ncbi:hypothetical protein [Streptomyces sp. NPDC057854]|uniref:hypothetical protein n=1 Tax=unclassified Streptomyces TaxID=2593676 RepID=UPI0036BD3381
MVDHLAVANWMFLSVNGTEDGDQPEPPKPVPRPGSGGDGEESRDGEPEPPAEAVSAGELARFFG